MTVWQIILQDTCDQDATPNEQGIGDEAINGGNGYREAKPNQQLHVQEHP